MTTGQGPDQDGRDRNGHDPQPHADADDVELRNELARHLGTSAYPADRDDLLRTLRGNHAPDRLLAVAARLPSGHTVESVQDIMRALGRGAAERPG